MIQLKNDNANKAYAGQAIIPAPQNIRLVNSRGLFHKILERNNEPHLTTKIYSYLPLENQADTVVTLQDAQAYKKIICLTKELHLSDFSEKTNPRLILTRFPNLQRIDLNQCGQRFSARDDLQYLNNLDRVTHLDLTFCSPIASQIDKLKFPELQSLNLTGWLFLKDEDIQKLVHYPKLTEVNVSYCSLITKTGIEQLAKIRDELNLPPIKFSGLEF